MADTALSALTATTALASGDLFYVVDGGASRKIDYDNVVAQIAAATKTLTNTTFDANGTGNTLSNVETADIASGSKSGADATLVTGTAGTSGNLASWNVDGDLVDSGSAPSAFATAAQGALADSAVQPGDDANTLGSGAATDGYVLTADGLGGAAWEVASGGGGTPAGSSGQFQYNNSGVFAAADLWQATNVVEQRNGTNAQTFNIYNTYDGTNNEWGFLKWNSNVFDIGTGSSGTGQARNLRLLSGGNINLIPATSTNYVRITFASGSSSGFNFNTNGFAMFGASSAVGDLGNSTYRWRDVYVGRSIIYYEQSSDPSDPVEGSAVVWQSNGTGSGDDGDIMMKITAGGVTKTATLVDFSALP